MISQRVLVVDDEPKMQRVLEIMLQRMGYEVSCASDGKAALQIMKSAPADLIISDLRMPGMSGTELLKTLRDEDNEVPVIIMTAYGTIETAVEAMKLGACEYIVRPFDVEALELVIARILTEGRIRQQNTFLRQEVEKGWGEFVGSSEPMQQVYNHIRQVAPSKTTVLITGETGTGKELVARAIHRTSPRHSALFVPINCAAIPADILESELFGYVRGAFTGAIKDRVGKFELADGGTLFLDELTEMPMPLQAKLLRVLQENIIERLGSNRSIPIDVRIIAATNRNPRQAISDGKLREDLYYRVNVFNIDLPALRERKEDIPALAASHLANQNKSYSISKAAMDSLQNYPWPGNVRELQNIIERAAVLAHGGIIEIQDFPQELNNLKTTLDISEQYADSPTLELNPAIERLEATMIRAALEQTGNNKSKAARLLDISERALWYKIKKLE
ncbi:sigma-54-dependent transcriptional regulator [Sulfuriferula nivalis]|uniref:Acetoacetate metabolism regulatory protein AtoC n=1 Tax=Sulfuriferula nivalis TaxID=2675298 RepID=A0A809RNN4_9PROT|nr:sigma-54 dependent transcriptional regulator [Sulfuriferula nivalis]BBP00421.1 acetoacetate metabolism regulatory protein AtoC [Sulfuriferula nivalis]